MAKTCIRVEACNIGSSERHNLRKIGDLNFSEIKRLREVFQQMFCE
jgi:hypothetical protein